MNNTSKNLDNSLSSALKKVLFCIKRSAPVGTTMIAEQLGMSGEAARLHVKKLLDMALIEGKQDDVPQVGRPKQEWIVTARGNRYFPDSHAELTIGLIDSVKTLFGEAGLEKLIAKREEDTLARYAAYCHAKTLPEKLAQLTELRLQEGYMAHLRQEDGDYLLIEEHCPICAAATVCQQFCRSEMALFQAILGDQVLIKREEYLLEAGQRCIYRITPIERSV